MATSLSPGRWSAALPSPALVGAVVLSAAAHALVLFGHQIDLSRQPDVVRLDARLTRTAPELKPGQAAQPEKPPQPKVRKKKPAPAPEAAVAETKAPPVEAPPPPQPVPEVKPSPPEPEPQPEIPPPPPEPPKAVGHAWPRAGVIRYLLFGGEGREVNPETSSSAELRWEITPEGRYQMKLESTDAKPFASMPWFKISLLWKSAGRVVDTGFQPERYEETISVFQHIEVNLDWDNKMVDFAGHRLPLPPGTLDYLSVIMQAGDPNFLERGVLSVATGRGLRKYQFESLGPVDLAMPFGAVWRTEQLVGKTGNNDVRVWVASDKFNLPVQIKFVVNKVNYYLLATEVLVAKEALLPAVPAVAEGDAAVSGTPQTTEK